jgi:hypothetical protein
VTVCFVCKRTSPDEFGGNYVLWVLHDGRLVVCCGICLDRLDEPREVVTYEEVP